MPRDAAGIPSRSGGTGGMLAGLGGSWRGGRSPVKATCRTRAAGSRGDRTRGWLSATISCTTHRPTRSRQRRAIVDPDRRDRHRGGQSGHADAAGAEGPDLGWRELAKRTYGEVLADNCLGLAAQLAYYFFLALFPALLFLVAVISFIPVTGLLDAITAMLARVAPGEVLSIVQDQMEKIAHGRAPACSRSACSARSGARRPG
jgi:hypothetical protein